MSFELVSRLVEEVGATAAGSTCIVAVDGPAEVDVVAEWCRATSNTVLAVHAEGVEVHRGPIDDPIAALPPERRPGHRLWVYTNFHCNLACDYCCVASSPRAAPRTVGVGDFAALVDAALDHGVAELYVTGGEPFLLLDLDDRLGHAVGRIPTTVLTNAMVWTGERRRRLEALPRDGLTLQISLDSVDAHLHDRHRGAGSHARAVAGIHLALELGFDVRVAATLGADAGPEADKLDAFFDELGLTDRQRVVRRIARQGAANAGLTVSRASLLPEVCVTAEGVWWHPVAATDPAMRVGDDWRPLGAVIEAVTDELREHRLRGDVLASTFPCA
ncbi:MAG: radical SAM protein [Acidimicrobiales bacterium]|jgi:pyruvate-formate lyase-activating enzyme|nr:radical SAM protein [Acidimicrobiales bacterium]